MSSIARELSVTVGTLTIAMNSLVKKGYVERRSRGLEDQRVVYISLSGKGRKKRMGITPGVPPGEMIRSLTSDLSEDEMQNVSKGADEAKSVV